LTTVVTDSTGVDADDRGERSPSLFGAAAEVPTRVLVLGMVRHDGSLEASDLYDVAEACGQSDEQVRSCLRRLVAEGLFTRRGEGRDARFEATPDCIRSMVESMERARLAFGQDAAGRGWDRSWHLVAFAIPEAKRASRDAFRDQLIHLGGAAIQNGLYVSPHGWEKAARDQAERLGVLEHTTFATTDDLEVAGVTDPRRLATMLWPLEDLGTRYQSFVDRYRHVPDLLDERRREKRRLTEAEFLPGSLAFGIEYQQCFDEDPLLPPELLPRPWPGRDARELVLTCRRLGVLLREEHDKPKLFAPWDDLLLSFRS
jgi:phenylacetic acid degradation operon negative regulatory protein